MTRNRSCWCLEGCKEMLYRARSYDVFISSLNWARWTVDGSGVSPVEFTQQRLTLKLLMSWVSSLSCLTLGIWRVTSTLVSHACSKKILIGWTTCTASQLRAGQEHEQKQPLQQRLFFLKTVETRRMSRRAWLVLYSSHNPFQNAEGQ